MIVLIDFFFLSCSEKKIEKKWLRTLFDSSSTSITNRVTIHFFITVSRIFFFLPFSLLGFSLFILLLLLYFLFFFFVFDLIFSLQFQLSFLILHEFFHVASLSLESDPSIFCIPVCFSSFFHLAEFSSSVRHSSQLAEQCRSFLLRQHPLSLAC